MTEVFLDSPENVGLRVMVASLVFLELQELKETVAIVDSMADPVHPADLENWDPLVYLVNLAYLAQLASREMLVYLALRDKQEAPVLQDYQVPLVSKVIVVHLVETAYQAFPAQLLSRATLAILDSLVQKVNPVVLR